jgi:hypothetical protein
MVLAFVLCAFFLVLPGALIASAAKMRVFDIIAVSPALSVACIGVSAMLGGATGIPWGWWLPLGLSGLIALLTALLPIGRPVLRTARSAFTRDWVAWGSLLIAAVIGTVQTMRAIGDMSSFSNTFDNTFHLNAVRFILDQGNASPLFVGSMNAGDGPSSYYPSVWHGIVALLVQATDVSILVATNVLTLVVVALVWPISLILLARSVSSNRFSWLITGALSGSFAVFPLLLLRNGVLYPNILGLAVLPAALGMIVWALRNSSTTGVTRSQAMVVGALAAAGTALGHPNAVLSLIALAAPAVLVRIIWLIARLSQWNRSSQDNVTSLSSRTGIIFEGVIFLLLIASVPVLWAVMRFDTVEPYRIIQIPVGEAVLRALGMAPLKYTISVFSVIAVLASMVVLLICRKHLWLILSYAVLIFLYIAGVSMPWEARDAITGLWYNDMFRITALLPIIGIPLIATASGELCKLLTLTVAKRMSRGASPPREARELRRLTRRIVSPVTAGVALVILLIPAFGATSMKEGERDAAWAFSTSPGSEVVTSDELEIMESVPDVVPENDTVMVNPWTGAAMTYALADRKTSSYHLLETQTADMEYLAGNLIYAFTDPQVCEEVQAHRAYYVLDFGEKEVLGGSHRDTYGGLLGLEEAGVAQTVLQAGDARLLQVTACSDTI